MDGYYIFLTDSLVGLHVKQQYNVRLCPSSIQYLYVLIGKFPKYFGFNLIELRRIRYAATTTCTFSKYKLINSQSSLTKAEKLATRSEGCVLNTFPGKLQMATMQHSEVTMEIPQLLRKWLISTCYLNYDCIGLICNKTTN